MKTFATVSLVLAAIVPLAAAAPTPVGFYPITNTTLPVASGPAPEVASRSLKPVPFKFERDAKSGARTKRSFYNGIPGQCLSRSRA
ncbi:hypothetical protein S7711_10926 [Stachybotrys chartarum IBT 7711]|uniref:Uncharacterized protein n=1 Tax=Stachybotrys chartarum (strain CBS 109288 / IBT 7711) TaxID=1280523 RepID=A0A084ANF0_STACB|nr:hypothetical protein S7711_10926 [Stachybotrys chartarum IBT 7711]KFA53207.1 hypothetical protein S40293_10681 [Stachybotrys chartarum IBT 40293]KFA76867.1 hypothetical protein S40288_10760 [Stachybotrys chartarum IBT 40288]